MKTRFKSARSGLIVVISIKPGFFSSRLMRYSLRNKNKCQKRPDLAMFKKKKEKCPGYAPFRRFTPKVNGVYSELLQLRFLEICSTVFIFIC